MRAKSTTTSRECQLLHPPHRSSSPPSVARWQRQMLSGQVSSYTLPSIIRRTNVAVAHGSVQIYLQYESNCTEARCMRGSLTIDEKRTRERRSQPGGHDPVVLAPCWRFMFIALAFCPCDFKGILGGYRDAAG